MPIQATTPWSASAIGTTCVSTQASEPSGRTNLYSVTHSAHASTAFAQSDAARAASSGWIVAVQPSPNASSAASPAIEHQRSLTYSYSPVADATNTPTGARAIRARNSAGAAVAVGTGRHGRRKPLSARRLHRSFFGKIGPT